MMPSNPSKSSGLVVYNGNFVAAAIDAIMRSATRRRGIRPRAWTAALMRPNARAASVSNGIGSNSFSARCSTSARRARLQLGQCDVLGLVGVRPVQLDGYSPCVVLHRYLRMDHRENVATVDPP